MSGGERPRPKPREKKMANETINLYFNDECRAITIGDTVTVFRTFGRYSVEHRGERAKFTRLTSKYAEFTTDSGSRVKVYGRNAFMGSMMYLGHYPAGGFKEAGYVVTGDAAHEIEIEKVQYLAWDKKTGVCEWRDK